MSVVKVSELQMCKPSANGRLMMVDNYDGAPVMRQITIGQLLGMQQEVLNTPCNHCGSRGKYDIRGNCGACGAPQEETSLK